MPSPSGGSRRGSEQAIIGVEGGRATGGPGVQPAARLMPPKMCHQASLRYPNPLSSVESSLHRDEARTPAKEKRGARVFRAVALRTAMRYALLNQHAADVSNLSGVVEPIEIHAGSRSAARHSPVPHAAVLAGLHDAFRQHRELSTLQVIDA